MVRGQWRKAINKYNRNNYYTIVTSYVSLPLLSADSVLSVPSVSEASGSPTVEFSILSGFSIIKERRLCSHRACLCHILTKYVQLFSVSEKEPRIKSSLTRFNKICHPSQRPRWQVDKEAIGLSRVQQCSSTYSPPS